MQVIRHLLQVPSPPVPPRRSGLFELLTSLVRRTDLYLAKEVAGAKQMKAADPSYTVGQLKSMLMMSASTQLGVSCLIYPCLLICQEGKTLTLEVDGFALDDADILQDVLYDGAKTPVTARVTE